MAAAKKSSRSSSSSALARQYRDAAERKGSNKPFTIPATGPGPYLVCGAFENASDLEGLL